MPQDSAKTHQDILISAKEEFLKHGFAGASQRRIAANAGVTTGALYRHFHDKDALFNALVAPVYNEFLAGYQAESIRFLKQLEEEGMDPMWASSVSEMSGFIDYVYANYDTFKLLVTCSEQSPYEHFTRSLIDMDVRMTAKYLELARQSGYPVREVSERELQLVVNAQFSYVLEFIIQDIPYEEAKQLMDSISRCITAGWKGLLME